MVVMEIVKEVTQWSVDYRQPNHTYLINNKGRVLAYAKWHSDDLVISKTPEYFDKRYRKFVIVKHAALSKVSKQFTDETVEKPAQVKPTENVRVFNVKSKNKIYTVTFNKNTKQVVCGCIGYNYRRKCKHSDAVTKQLGV
jgi:hypothetical protein